MLRIALATCILLNLILFYSLVWGERGTLAYTQLKNQCASLETEMASLDTTNFSLQKEIFLLKNDEQYLEKMIRKKLNFVRTDEILYIFPQ